MTFAELENDIVTEQQQTAFEEYCGNPSEFWQWYDYWCYENSLFNDK